MMKNEICINETFFDYERKGVGPNLNLIQIKFVGLRKMFKFRF